MGKYVIRRLLQMIPVIIGVTFIIYAAVFSLGDPTVGRCGERACPPGYIEAFRAEYNLDKPLIVQYVLYMGNLLQGDLGTNFFCNSVSEELLERFPTTLKLGFMALIIESVIGMRAMQAGPLGVAGAASCGVCRGCCRMHPSTRKHWRLPPRPKARRSCSTMPRWA